MFLKDSYGNRSLTATMAIVAFVIVMLKVLLSGASFNFGGLSYSFGTIDSLTVGAILAPVLGSYTVRRWGMSPNDVETDDVQDPGSNASDGGKNE